MIPSPQDSQCMLSSESTLFSSTWHLNLWNTDHRYRCSLLQWIWGAMCMKSLRRQSWRLNVMLTDTVQRYRQVHIRSVQTNWMDADVGLCSRKRVKCLYLWVAIHKGGSAKAAVLYYYKNRLTIEATPPSTSQMVWLLILPRNGANMT